MARKRIELDKKSFDELFDKHLKPFKSKNGRILFKIFIDNLHYTEITTYDIVLELERYNIKLEKKEVNAWLLSLYKADLIKKNPKRGKPTTIPYYDKYTYDLWSITEIGLKIGTKLTLLMYDDEVKYRIPHINEMFPKILEEVEDLYITTKLLLTLHNSGGSMAFSSLRKNLAISKEKLAVYSWPDSSYSEKPLFEIKKKPLSFKNNLLKIFGMVSEDDLIFNLTTDGKKLAEVISSRIQE